MLKELLYLGPQQKLRSLFSSIYVQDLYRATPATFRTHKAIIEENAGNPIANQKKALRVKIFQDTNRAI
jgi:hypothetical protein